MSPQRSLQERFRRVDESKRLPNHTELLELANFCSEPTLTVRTDR